MHGDALRDAMHRQIRLADMLVAWAYCVEREDSIPYSWPHFILRLSYVSIALKGWSGNRQDCLPYDKPGYDR
jgi:hypothetical protein